MSNYKTDALLSGLTTLTMPYLEPLAISYLRDRGEPLSPKALEQAKYQVMLQLSTAIRQTQSDRN